MPINNVNLLGGKNGSSHPIFRLLHSRKTGNLPVTEDIKATITVGPLLILPDISYLKKIEMLKSTSTIRQNGKHKDIRQGDH